MADGTDKYRSCEKAKGEGRNSLVQTDNGLQRHCAYAPWDCGQVNNKWRVRSGLPENMLLLLHLQWCKLHLLWPNFWHATCGSNECHRLAVRKDKEWRTSFFHRSQRRRKCNFCVSFSLRWQHGNEHAATPVVILDGCSCCCCSLCCCCCCCCGCKCGLPLLLR